MSRLWAWILRAAPRVLRAPLVRGRALAASRPGRDLLLMLSLVIAFTAIAVVLDLNERLVLSALEHPAFDDTGLENVPVGLAIASVGAAWFAYRRWREHHAEANAHRVTMEQLRLAMDQVVEASQAKSQFLAAMSHELRTPLNAILGFSELIRSEALGPTVGPKYRDYANDIHAAGSLLLSIVNDILDMARLEAGTLRFEPEDVDVAETLERVRRMISVRAVEGGLDLQATAPPGLIAWADPAKLRQAVLNLAFNAVKFTPRGGRVTFSACREGEFARIEVADTGVGIAKDDIAKALTPFQRIDNRLQRRDEGTGLGLPLAKRYMERQGGSLDLESEVGHGTTAILRIPLALRKADAAD